MAKEQALEFVKIPINVALKLTRVSGYGRTVKKLINEQKAELNKGSQETVKKVESKATKTAKAKTK